MKVFEIAPLAALLFASALARPSNAGAESQITPDQFNQSIIATIEQAGYGYKSAAFASFASTITPGYTVQIPGCGTHAILVPAFYESLDSLKYITSTLQIRHTGNSLTYIYTNHKSDRLSRYAISWQRLALSIQSWFGANTHLPIKALVVISSHPDCTGLSEMNWSHLWLKDQIRHRTLSQGSPDT